MTYAENWTLICKLHRHLAAIEKEKPAVDPTKESKEHWWPSKGELKDPASSFSLPTASSFSLATNPLSTPVKGPSQFLQEGKSRWQSMGLIEEIKRIVGTEGSDREKVRQLRQLLGLQEEEGQEEEELRDLLSDYKKKHEVILID